MKLSTSPARTPRLRRLPWAAVVVLCLAGSACLGHARGEGAAGGAAAGGDPGDANDAVGSPARPPLYTGVTPLVQSYAFRGRFDMTNPQRPQMEWENAAIGLRVKGTTQVTAVLDNVQERNPDNYIIVEVDGVETLKLSFTKGVTTYVVAQNLTPGEHTVWLAKGQEYGFGPIAFGGVTLDAGGTLMAPPVLPNRRMEFIGSSTMTGWGADSRLDPTLDCNDEVNYPAANAQHAIPRYTADALNADFMNISRGAAGMQVSFARGVSTLPQSYPGIIDSSDAAWDSSQWPADVVVIEAGGSDFAAGDGPPATVPVGTLLGFPSPTATAMQQFSIDTYEATYRAFVADLRQRYPGVLVVLVNTKNMSGQSTDLLYSTLDKVAASFTDGRVVRFDYFTTPLSEPSPYPSWRAMADAMGHACLDHPTPENAQILAHRLALFIRGKAGW